MAAPLPRRPPQVDARTVICVLTHDPKFDVPLLEVALQTDAAYIGAMGSRRTHDDRLARLRERGRAARRRWPGCRSPIGLDIGARTPEETAVSIAAEIVARRWGGTGQPLTRTDGPIHATHDAAPRRRREPSPGWCSPPAPGRRFGGPKALVEIDGERLVDRAVRVLRDGGVDPAYVVAGCGAAGRSPRRRRGRRQPGLGRGHGVVAAGRPGRAARRRRRGASCCWSTSRG